MKKIITVLLIPFFLCSCKANREIDEQSIVSAVCFEKSEELTVFLEILTVSIDAQNITTRIFKASGKNPEEVFKRLNASLPKRLLFDHCAAIVLSKNMNKHTKKTILNYCIDEPTVNLGTPVVYTENITSLLSSEHESAAVGYDIMQILRHNNLEKQSRLYKTAVNTKGIVTFENINGKVTIV